MLSSIEERDSKAKSAGVDLNVGPVAIAKSRYA